MWVNRLLRLLLWQADEHGFDPWLPHPIPSSIFLWYNLSLIYHFHEDVCVNGRKSCFSEGARLVLPGRRNSDEARFSKSVLSLFMAVCETGIILSVRRDKPSWNPVLRGRAKKGLCGLIVYSIVIEILIRGRLRKGVTADGSARNTIAHQWQLCYRPTA